MNNSQSAPTPLDSLIEANAKVYKSRRKQAKAPVIGNEVEFYYRRQLNGILKKAANLVIEEVLPVLKVEKKNYAVDSRFTMDGWSDKIIAALAKALSSFETGAFSEQVKRLAKSTVSMAEAASTKAFLESVNSAVGIDLNNVISNEGMTDYLEAAVQQNISLIKSIPQEYLKSVETIVLEGTRAGYAPSVIAKQLSEKYGSTKRRAAFIAEDQVNKISSDINRYRQVSSGIEYYRSVDSGDIAVTGRPGGKYPNAKISCWRIARKDIGYGPGVYKWSEGASDGGETGLYPGRHHPRCRCTPSPVFEWELPEKKQRDEIDETRESKINEIMKGFNELTSKKYQPRLTAKKASVRTKVTPAKVAPTPVTLSWKNGSESVRKNFVKYSRNSLSIKVSKGDKYFKAVESYTQGQEFYEINQSFITGSKYKNPEVVKALDDLISNSKSSSNLSVYRGLDDDFLDSNDLDNIGQMDKLINKGYMSTSFNPDVSKEFIESDRGLMKIEVPKGFSALPVDEVLGLTDTMLKDPDAYFQYEVLLPRNVVLKNTGKVEVIKGFDGEDIPVYIFKVEEL